MTNSLMQWHLARDNQTQLHKFCAKHKVKSQMTTADEDTFNIRFDFDNGSFIEVELLRGTAETSFSVADHFQVIDYGWATA